MLRLRTNYSFRTAIGTIDQYLSVLPEDQTYLPITDRGNTYGWFEWRRKVEALGKIPIYGVELGVYMDAAMEDKKAPRDYWLFFAKDELATLSRLMTLATKQFYHEPVLTLNQACDFHGIKVMGRKCCDVQVIDPSTPDLYAPVGPGISYSYQNYCRDKGFRQVLCGENVYPENTEEYRIQHMLTVGPRKASINTWNGSAKIDWWAYDKALQQVSIDVLSQCQLKIPQVDLPTPKKEKSLKQLCLESPRAGVLQDAAYRDRLEMELGLIEEKEFVNYFHIVYRLCKWCVDRDIIVGPGRGSSAGSLVCYLLGITAADPIQHGLLFGRFLSPDRAKTDPPDIDIDFPDTDRAEILEYLKSEYGPKNVAKLGTIMKFGPRSAINTTGNIYGIPREQQDEIADAMIKRSGGDARAQYCLEDTFTERPPAQKVAKHYPLIQHATKLEGMMSGSGTHACAIIVSSNPLEQTCSFDAKGDSIMMDKKDAEFANVLKMDVLGLTQLSILKECCKQLGHDIQWLYNIPLHDQAALDVLNDYELCGIFQYEGTAVRNLTLQLGLNGNRGFKSFDDVYVISSLSRPGPLANGAAARWMSVRVKGTQPESIHPIIDQFLDRTNGIVIFQEQVMEIAGKVGKLPIEQVNLLRKGMSKSKGIEHFNQFGDPWKKAAIESGIPQEIAEDFWTKLCTYGSWTFNKSHAVAYGLLSWWCCYMKAHHRELFYRVSLNREKVNERKREMLVEAERLGYKVNLGSTHFVSWEDRFLHGGQDWSVESNPDDPEDKHIVAPWSNYFGISHKSVYQLNTAAWTSLRGGNWQDMLSNSMKGAFKNGRLKIPSLYPIQELIERERNKYQRAKEGRSTNAPARPSSRGDAARPLDPLAQLAAASALMSGSKPTARKIATTLIPQVRERSDSPVSKGTFNRRAMVTKRIMTIYELVTMEKDEKDRFVNQHKKFRLCGIPIGINLRDRNEVTFVERRIADNNRLEGTEDYEEEYDGLLPLDRRYLINIRLKDDTGILVIIISAKRYHEDNFGPNLMNRMKIEKSVMVCEGHYSNFNGMDLMFVQDVLFLR